MIILFMHFLFVQKMKELTENLEKIESECKVTLFNLKKKKRMKHGQLKAAQVRRKSCTELFLLIQNKLISLVYILKLTVQTFSTKHGLQMFLFNLSFIYRI